MPISELLYFGKPLVHFDNSCLTEFSAGAGYVVQDLHIMIIAFHELFSNEQIYNYILSASKASANICQHG